MKNSIFLRFFGCQCACIEHFGLEYELLETFPCKPVSARVYGLVMEFRLKSEPFRLKDFYFYFFMICFVIVLVVSSMLVNG